MTWELRLSKVCLWIISDKNRKALAATYQQQMQCYKNGVSEIRPQKNIKAALLFTHFKHLEYLDLQ